MIDTFMDTSVRTTCLAVADKCKSHDGFRKTWHNIADDTIWLERLAHQ